MSDGNSGEMKSEFKTNMNFTFHAYTTEIMFDSTFDYKRLWGVGGLVC